MSNDVKTSIQQNVMAVIRKGELKMRPKWYFVVGSFAMVIGLMGLTILSIFLVSLASFSLRTHGPMGEIRFEQLLSTFPWGAAVVATIGIVTGVFLLKRYDFSYKKNFTLIIGGFVLAILCAGWLINYSGLDSIWMHKGPMKEFYQKYDGGMRHGSPWRMQ